MWIEGTRIDLLAPTRLQQWLTVFALAAVMIALAPISPHAADTIDQSAAQIVADVDRAAAEAEAKAKEAEKAAEEAVAAAEAADRAVAASLAQQPIRTTAPIKTTAPEKNIAPTQTASEVKTVPEVSARATAASSSAAISVAPKKNGLETVDGETVDGSQPPTNLVTAALAGQSCREMRTMRNKLINRGIKGTMAKGPKWVLANVAGDQLLDVKIYITLVERLKFRCSAGGALTTKKITKRPKDLKRPKRLKRKAALKSKKKVSSKPKYKKKRVVKKKKYRKVVKKKPADVYTSTDAFR